MSKKKIIISMIVMAVLLGGTFAYTKFWWGWKKTAEDISDIVDNKEKQLFYVDIKKGKNFWKNSYIKKIGRVVSEEEIEIKSQANGRISKISVKEWQKITKNKNIINLSDTLSSYWLSVAKAQLNIEASQIDYNQSKLSLDKAISDAKLALDKAKTDQRLTLNKTNTDARLTLNKTNIDAKLTLDKTVIDGKNALDKAKNDLKQAKLLLEKNLDQAELNLQNSKEPEKDTTFEIQKDKIKTSIQNAQLDVASLKNKNIQQLMSFGSSTISTYNNLDNVMLDIIDFSDQLLGVTDTHKRKNDRFEDFLGIKSRTHLQDTKQEFLAYSKFRQDVFVPLNNLSQVNYSKMNSKLYEELFAKGDTWYMRTLGLLKNLLTVMDNSIISVGSLDQVTINSYKSQINAYETQVLSSKSSYLTFKSNVRTFLNTYREWEDTAEEKLKSFQNELNLLEKNKTITKDDLKFAKQNNELALQKIQIDGVKQIKSLELALEAADASYQNALASAKANSENALETAKANSENALETAKANASNAVKVANANYQNALKQKEINLAKISNLININKNSKYQASKELGKLKISSPISGTITDVLVDEWQDVSVGTPLVKISSLTESAVEISISEGESKLLKIWDSVYTALNWKKVKWSIVSISLSADNNLNYKTKISFGSKFDSLWNIVDLVIPVETGKRLVPLNIIEVIGKGKGMINTISWGTVAQHEIKLWEVWWDSIEVISSLPSDMQVITTNLSNFDTNRFIIQDRSQKKEIEEAAKAQKEKLEKKNGDNNDKEEEEEKLSEKEGDKSDQDDDNEENKSNEDENNEKDKKD